MKRKAEHEISSSKKAKTVPVEFLSGHDRTLRDHSVYERILLENYKKLFARTELTTDFANTVDVILEFVPRRDDFDALEAVALEEYGLDLDNLDNTPPKHHRKLIYKILHECMKSPDSFFELARSRGTRTLRNLFHGNSRLPGYNTTDGYAWRYRKIMKIQKRLEKDCRDLLSDARSPYDVYQDAPMVAFFLYVQWLDPKTTNIADRPHLGACLPKRLPKLTEMLIQKFPICVNLDSTSDCIPHFEEDTFHPSYGRSKLVEASDIIEAGSQKFWKKGFTLYSPRHPIDGHSDFFEDLWHFDSFVCQRRDDIQTTEIRMMSTLLVDSPRKVISGENIILCIDGVSGDAQHLGWKEEDGTVMTDLPSRLMAVLLLVDTEVVLWAQHERFESLLPFFKDLVEKNETWQLYCAERRRKTTIVCPQIDTDLDLQYC